MYHHVNLSVIFLYILEAGGVATRVHQRVEARQVHEMREGGLVEYLVRLNAVKFFYQVQCSNAEKTDG